MAKVTPSKTNYTVQHDFEGDAGILKATLERRTEIRTALSALARDLQRLQDSPAQVKAEIHLQIGGDAPTEHVYRISITDQGFDAAAFARAVPHADSTTERCTTLGTNSSPHPASQANGQQAPSSLSTPRSGFQRTDLEDDSVELRPFKKQKTSMERGVDAKTGSQRVSQTPVQPTPSANTTETMNYLNNWHDEWTRQGGWLFDTLTKTSDATSGLRGSVEKKLEAMQDVLGHSINTANAGVVAELGSITKLMHWLEHCRKTSADKLQAREEKWRSSSATFHDSARREREAAESRIERKLDEQNEMLLKLARATDILHTGTGQKSGASDEKSREPSLGAQFTAELNVESDSAWRNAE